MKMDGNNTEDVQELLLRLQRERAALIDRGMILDGQLAIYGTGHTKTDTRKRSEILIERKDVERKAYTIKQQIRAIEDSRMSAQKKNIAPMAPPKAEPEEVVDCIPVTDHAVIRWLERKHGLDIEQMKRDIYEEAMGDSDVIYKNGTFYKVVKDNFVYVVSGNTKTVVTCYAIEDLSDVVTNAQWKEIKNAKA